VQRFGVWAIVAVVPFVILYDHNTHLFYYRGVLALLGVCMVLLVMAALVDGSFSRLLGTRPLVWLGQRSYSVYLWHYPVLVATTWCNNHRFALHLSLPVECLFAGVITIALAEASFRYVEQPLRRRLAPVQVISSMRSSAMRAPSAVSGSTTI
jgi:peptidoglycan/LPS O-acetylase OafA/YrhL